MWPWEHVAFGYLCLSVYWRWRKGDPPADGAALVVVFGAALPDLVDKPLAWSLGVFPQGYALGHSVFVWILVGAAILSVAVRSVDRRGHAVALGVGVGSHLLGDVLYPVLLGGDPALGRVLWPVVTLPPYGESLGLVGRTLLYVRHAAGHALAEGLLPVVVELGFLLGVLALWVADGRPGLRLSWVGRSPGSDRPGG